MSCPNCGCTPCFCGTPGFVTYRGYTLEQALRSVGGGWAKIVQNLWDHKPPQTLIIQVKEKFGTLRWYTENSTKEYEQLIRKAEIESGKTCEECGTTTSVTLEGGWIKALCLNCRQECNEKWK